MQQRLEVVEEDGLSWVPDMPERETVPQQHGQDYCYSPTDIAISACVTIA